MNTQLIISQLIFSQVIIRQLIGPLPPNPIHADQVNLVPAIWEGVTLAAGHGTLSECA